MPFHRNVLIRNIYSGFAWCPIGDDTDYGQCNTEAEPTLFIGQMDIVFNWFNSIPSSNR